jgi:5-methylcytosine-specific restriction endonuclease McrA
VVKQPHGGAGSAAVTDTAGYLWRGEPYLGNQGYPKANVIMVFVVDTEQRPLAPCHPARARRLLTEGKAAVWRRYPFTIILKRAVPAAHPEPLRVKIDPGSKTTGLALVNDRTGQVAWAAELTHRGQRIREALLGATNVPLQVEHIIPKARGGSNRVSNLTLACQSCNDAKGTQTAEEFGHPGVQAQARRPLKDAAAVNASRWALYRRLQATGLPVEVGTGGRTKWNRTQRGLPKAHWIDAACVGVSTPEQVICVGIVPLAITATGRHSRQMCRTNAYGFPDKAPKATSRVVGMRTGDLVRAVVPALSIKVGTYVGRLAVRATGSCNIKTSTHTVQVIHIRYCRPLHRADGYNYQKGEAALPPHG